MSRILKGIHTVKKRLADGSERTYYYLGHGKNARRIRGEFGSPEFIENYNELLAPPRRGWIYFIWAGSRIKIGFSRTPFKRLDQLKTGISSPVKMMMAVAGMPSDERKLRVRLKTFRTSGEWFTVRDEVLAVVMECGLKGRVASEGDEE